MHTSIISDFDDFVGLSGLPMERYTFEKLVPYADMDKFYEYFVRKRESFDLFHIQCSLVLLSRRNYSHGARLSIEYLHHDSDFIRFVAASSLTEYTCISHDMLLSVLDVLTSKTNLVKGLETYLIRVLGYAVSPPITKHILQSKDKLIEIYGGSFGELLRDLIDHCDDDK